MLLPKQAISYGALRAQGIAKPKILSMCTTLKLFPTPFKGIYYVPLEEERKGGIIEKPLKVLSQATALFLGSSNFYFSCATAEKALGLDWQPSGNIHIVNEKLSRRISLNGRIEKNGAKSSWRAKKIKKLLSFYGTGIIFHRGSVDGAKTRQTPYGRFARPSQIVADRKRFRENAKQNEAFFSKKKGKGP